MSRRHRRRALCLLWWLSSTACSPIDGTEAGSDAGPEDTSLTPDLGSEGGVVDASLDARDATDARSDVAAPPCTAIGAPPDSLGVSEFYEKYVDASGIPVLSSGRVPDRALLVACTIITRELSKRDDVRAQMVAHRARVAVMAHSEVTTDIPEHSDLYEAFPGVDWDDRARGLGGTVARPATSCAEENLLCYPTDPYRGENILVHELAHGMASLGIDFVDPTFRGRLRAAYDAALAAGKWKDTYAATNPDEYWAEGVQSWFDENLGVDPPNGIHNFVNTRAELLEYDPALYALVAEFFPDGPHRPTCP